MIQCGEVQQNKENCRKFYFADGAVKGRIVQNNAAHTTVLTDQCTITDWVKRR